MPKGHMEPVAGPVLGTYDYSSKAIPITVTVRKDPRAYVPTYEVSIASISHAVESILERIRLELIKQVNLGIIDIIETKRQQAAEQKFDETIRTLIEKYFPDQDEQTRGFLSSYLSAKALGLGTIELLMDDRQLEEIVINQASEPVWVYHKQYGWLRTTIYLRDEEQIRHYASIVGRKVGRQITVLDPLLDASMNSGDRVNATLSPISTNGNTMTIRKFSRDPWTITRLVKGGTITPEAAAWLWMAIHYEMSCIVAGGTASGKTSALNCFANFFPPNQRIISIEDTREIQLPSFLHWVPMNTRRQNAEGRGQLSMGDLLINSLRMRPDRIIVGEVRRKLEAETLFEAIHTGHSVYATFHANNAEEAIDRLTNAPIEVPPIMLPAISLLIVQFRNRRTGSRRTFQIAEITKDAKANVILQYDPAKDKLIKTGRSNSFFASLKLYTGYSDAQIAKEIAEKQAVIEYLVQQSVFDVDAVGRIIGEYYTNKDELMKYVKQNKPLPILAAALPELPNSLDKRPQKE
jgi:flagellar protein FlaI